MKLTVLVDNISSGDLLSEWGLSVHIDHNGTGVLLDTGASGSFADNAEALGIDLSRVELAALSHAHYDHSDGMEAFFVINSFAPFYLDAGARENCYSREEGGYKYIGIARGTLERYGKRIRFNADVCEVLPGLWLIPHDTAGLSRMGAENNMYLFSDGRWIPDDFSHEQTLVLETERGLFVINSCTHSGPEVVLDEVSRALPGKKITCFFGGLHLFQKSEEEVRCLAETLRSSDVETFYTGHCTGPEAFRILREELGDRMKSFCCGMEIEM